MKRLSLKTECFEHNLKGGYNGKKHESVELEFENLDKDSDSRKSAMKALKSYVKDLDSNAIPIFLARVSEIKETGLTSSEYAISLYEDIARVHGTIIVPHIENIMLTIIKTLTYGAGSCDLHQACLKVVYAIARYGMDPTTPEAEKQDIMHSLCKPLSDSLLARQENLSSGAALCLKGLVELDNWRFSSSQMVNEVCQRVVAALEKPMQGDSHMGLVMALAEHNSLVLEGYARLLVQAGVRVLNMGVTEGDLQKQLSAIQMINSLMRSLDYKAIRSELTFVIEELQKYQNDQMEDVKGVAFEAIQTAKRILWSNVDVSLKDGLFSGEMNAPRSAIERFETREDHENGFSGILHRSLVNSDPRSATPSPQRSRLYVNDDSINHFTTPRKPVNCIQVPDDDGCSNCQSRRFRSPSSSKFNQILDSCYDHNGFNESFTDEDQQFNSTSELLCSTEDIPTAGSNNLQQSEELVPETRVRSQILSAVSIYSGLFVLLVAVVCYSWIRDVDEGYNLVPT